MLKGADSHLHGSAQPERAAAIPRHRPAWSVHPAGVSHPAAGHSPHWGPCDPRCRPSDALAARGDNINNAIGAFRPLVIHLGPVARNLASPKTDFGGLTA